MFETNNLLIDEAKLRRYGIIKTDTGFERLKLKVTAQELADARNLQFQQERLNYLKRQAIEHDDPKVWNECWERENRLDKLRNEYWQNLYLAYNIYPYIDWEVSNLDGTLSLVPGFPIPIAIEELLAEESKGGIN